MFHVFLKSSVTVSVFGLTVKQWPHISNVGCLNPPKNAYCNSSRSKLNQYIFFIYKTPAHASSLTDFLKHC